MLEPAVARSRATPRWIIVIAAGVAGAIAINAYLIVAEVFVLHGATIAAISQWDASNVLGPAAFDGGGATALLGFGMHLVVSTAWAALFLAIASRAPLVMRHPLASGIVFGAVVMCVMILFVVPLGRAPHGHITLAGWIDRSLAHTLFFGVPVAWVVTALSRPKQ